VIVTKEERKEFLIEMMKEIRRVYDIPLRSYWHGLPPVEEQFIALLERMRWKKRGEEM